MTEALILVINPGSTSTKMGVFRGEEKILERNLHHEAAVIAGYAGIADQYDFRKRAILDELASAGIDLGEVKVIVGRGGLIKPVPSGVFEVNEAMEADLRAGVRGQHASNLGGLIARDLALSLPGARAFIADPVVVDEMDEVARVAGHPEFERASIFHALNQKAIARLHAGTVGRRYEEMNLIVAHMGGGISVGAHRKGRVVDVNQALDGEGPFSPERSGTLPAGALARLCFSGKLGPEQVKRMINGCGGYVAHLGTNSAREVEERAAAGDARARLVRDALIYQVAKEIGGMSTVLKGEVDGILLTGGLAWAQALVADLTGRVRHLGPVFVYPGEDELRALASNGLRVLRGEAEVLEYT